MRRGCLAEHNLLEMPVDESDLKAGDLVFFERDIPVWKKESVNPQKENLSETEEEDSLPENQQTEESTEIVYGFVVKDGSRDIMIGNENHEAVLKMNPFEMEDVAGVYRFDEKDVNPDSRYMPSTTATVYEGLGTGNKELNDFEDVNDENSEKDLDSESAVIQTEDSVPGNDEILETGQESVSFYGIGDQENSNQGFEAGSAAAGKPTDPLKNSEKDSDKNDKVSDGMQADSENVNHAVYSETHVEHHTNNIIVNEELLDEDAISAEDQSDQDSKNDDSNSQKVKDLMQKIQELPSEQMLEAILEKDEKGLLIEEKKNQVQQVLDAYLEMDKQEQKQVENFHSLLSLVRIFEKREPDLMLFSKKSEYEGKSVLAKFRSDAFEDYSLQLQVFEILRYQQKEYLDQLDSFIQENNLCLTRGVELVDISFR